MIVTTYVNTKDSCEQVAAVFSTKYSIAHPLKGILAQIFADDDNTDDKLLADDDIEKPATKKKSMKLGDAKADAVDTEQGKSKDSKAETFETENPTSKKI